MVYYLWNQDTANLVGSYATLNAALREVADAAQQYGPTSREVLSLGLTKGMSQALAHGQELLGLAESSTRKGPRTARRGSGRQAA